MRFGAIWIPRSVTHFREFPPLLESISDIDADSIDTKSGIYNSQTGEGYDDVGYVEFRSEQDEEELIYRYTQIGMLVIEGPDEFNQTELLERCKEVYIQVAKQKWVVLARQLDEGHIPFGKARLNLGTFSPTAIFEAVAHDYLQECLEKSRSYTAETKNEEITDLLQRINQVDSCFEYMSEVYDFSNPDLRQHLDYSHALINMLFQNIEIKSERRRQNQLRNLEIIVAVLTVVIVGIEIAPMIQQIL